MRRERQWPTKVGDTLQRVLQRYDPNHRMEAYRVWTFWDEEVGDSVAKHAQPDGFRAGVLSVRVDNSTWMQELQFMKESLRSRLNKRLDEPMIQDIYFVSGKTVPAKTKAPPPDQPPVSTEKPRPIPMPRLKNPEISEAFKRVALAHAKRPRDPGRDRK